VTNWAAYNQGLRLRGDTTFWISGDALGFWPAPRRTTRGGQPRYSDRAIDLCLTLRMVFHQPLCQTQGLMRCIAALSGLAISVPGFSPLSRRGAGLTLHATQKPARFNPVQLIVDSIGLKIFGAGDWLEERHKIKRKRRSWRKLHLGLYLVSAEIENQGRMARRKATGYNQRSRGKTLVGRWKTVIGPKLKAHSFDNQKTEA
jgi:hypothetical protein